VDDQAHALQRLIQHITGRSIFGQEEIRRAIEHYIEREFDFFYDDEEQALYYPEEGAEVVLVWARPRQLRKKGAFKRLVSFFRNISIRVRIWWIRRF